MALVLTLLLLILLFAVLLFAVKSKIALVMDSTSSDFHMTLSWLYPLLKSEVKKEGDTLVLAVYLMNKRILTRELKGSLKTRRNGRALRDLEPTDIHIDARYGFRDPFVTGLAVSAVTLASEFFKVESLQQRPDFLTVSDYFRLNATARLNLGNSLLKLI